MSSSDHIQMQQQEQEQEQQQTLPTLIQRAESSTPPQPDPPTRHRINRYVRILHLFNLTNPEPDATGTSPECYACTQPGPLTFHSATSSRPHHPATYVSTAGSSLIPIQDTSSPATRTRNPKSFLGPVLDPRSNRIQNWNRVVLFARAAALLVDPLFFYSLSVGRGGLPCLGMDRRLAVGLAGVRTCVDMVHVAHVCVQLRVAYVSRESLVIGCGKLVWDPRMIAEHYLWSPKWFLFDAYAVLPVPQVVFLWLLPRLITKEEIGLITTTLLLVLVFQYLPKVYHSICVLKRMKKVTGYIFGTIWWGFALNLIAYFMASHVVGGCWYVLAIQRVASCLRQQCQKNNTCELMSLACYKIACKPSLPSVADKLSCNNFTTSVGQNIATCLYADGSFLYGIYDSARQVVASDSIAVKILYPIFWGIMILSSFGNSFEPTSHWLEVIFCMIVILSGLALFTLLIGNIQVLLHVVMARKRKMQLRSRDMEWWMSRRQLPSRLRKRVRQYERQRWAAMRGEDEMDIVKDLPEGLRRDVKRHLCLDLIRKVPLFHKLDDLILDNICDRVEHLVFSKDEKIIREGDPVQRMVFIVRGQLQSSQQRSKGMVSKCIIGPGNFLGDELLSWCLRRPFIDRLPSSSATFECIEATEAFGLGAHHLRFITEHFRYKFANESLKRTARYYSSNWRTWAAVNIQLAWRRYKNRTSGMAIQPSEIGDNERRLRLYAAMFMSIRPHDHLE